MLDQTHVLKRVTLYTDGACSGNPGPGGWGFVLQHDKNGIQHTVEGAGFVAETTNNRMEITAVIEGLRRLNQSCHVTVCSDSTYVVHAFEKHWLDSWQRNQWKTSQNKPVENQDLWQALLMAIESHQMAWIKVPGHQDNEWNNHCDKLARGQIKLNKTNSKMDNSGNTCENDS